MGTIQRPLKLYGTRKYVDEVAADADHLAPILSAEVDADLDTIYTAWNGGVDAVNIKPGVITTAHLADGSVTDPKIASLGWDKVTGKPTYYPISPSAITTAQIADGAVTGAKIADGSIGTADIADAQITKYKIAPSQSMWVPPQVATANGPNGAVVPFSDVTILANPYQPARSFVYCIGWVNGVAFQTVGSGTTAVTITAKIMAAGAQVADTSIPLNLAINQIMPWSLFLFGNRIGAGPFNLTLSAAGASITINVARSQLIVIEPS